MLNDGNQWKFIKNTDKFIKPNDFKFENPISDENIFNQLRGIFTKLNLKHYPHRHYLKRLYLLNQLSHQYTENFGIEELQLYQDFMNAKGKWDPVTMSCELVPVVKCIRKHFTINYGYFSDWWQAVFFNVIWDHVLFLQRFGIDARLGYFLRTKQMDQGEVNVSFVKDFDDYQHLTMVTITCMHNLAYICVPLFLKYKQYDWIKCLIDNVDIPISMLTCGKLWNWRFNKWYLICTSQETANYDSDYRLYDINIYN